LFYSVCYKDKNDDALDDGKLRKKNNFSFDNLYLMAFYSAQIGNILPTFRENCRSHLQGSCNSWSAWLL